MNPRFGGRRYSIDSFDRHLSLKAPLPLLLALVFLSRSVVLRLVYALSNIKGQGADISVLWNSQYQHLFMLGSLPAFLVLAAYIGRSPNRGAMARWIWRHGAWLVGLALLAQSLPALLNLDSITNFEQMHFEESPLLLAVHAAVLGYMLFSRRVRDTFADYPKPDPRP
jgi:Protein of unknown function (DUF2919)